MINPPPPNVHSVAHQPCFINYCSNKNLLFTIYDPDIQSDTSGTPACTANMYNGSVNINFILCLPY